MERSEELEKAKQRLIERFIALQDQADAVNEQIYKLTVEIEILNVKITEAKSDEERARMTGAKASAQPPADRKRT